MADPIVGQISVGDGATFTPSVSNTGVISWSNNKELPNPPDLDVVGLIMPRLEYGHPFQAATVADMTDTTKIYVYTGSETGYTFGDWYYYDGSAWVSGGVYNAIAFNTDPTLKISGAAADAEVTGNKIQTATDTELAILDIYNHADENPYVYTTSSFEQGYRHGDGTVQASSKYVVSTKMLLFGEGTKITPPLSTKFYIVLEDGTIYASKASTSETLLTYTFTENVIAYLEVYKDDGISSYTLSINYKCPITDILATLDIFRQENTTEKSIPSTFWSASNLCNLEDCANLDKVYICNKNLLPAFTPSTYTVNDVTLSYDATTGGYSFNGTASDTAAFSFSVTNTPPITGGTYTLSLKNSAIISDSITFLELTFNNGLTNRTIQRNFSVSNAKVTFIVAPNEKFVGYRFRVSKNVTFPAGFICYPQFEAGEEETDIVPSIINSFTPVTADTENVTCNVGYNYICAKGTMTGKVKFYFSLKHELELLTNNVSSKFKGKTIVCFGDSVTGNEVPPYDYPTMLGELTGATVYNAGFGGCCMSDNNQERKLFSMCRLADSIVEGDFSAQRNSGVSITYRGTSINYVPSRLDVLESIDWTKVDYITIAYGTNDWNANYGLDNPDNPLDTTTYIGAFRYAVEELLTAYPNLKILAITPLYRFWDTNTGMPSGVSGDYIDSNTYAKGTGYYLWNYGDALIEAAKWYHIPVCDMYFKCMMCKQNRHRYFATNDGTHPILTGQILFTEILKACLDSNY